MKIPDFLADQLSNAGVRQIFGVPGGASIPWIEAFKNAGIEFILTTGESGAAIMADVTSRLTGIPGVCHATFGPGATNISTGIGCALLDRSSVIVLTSEMDNLMIRRTTQMNIDHQGLFRPLTKATFRLNPENAAEIIPAALEICRREYPGPVHIGLPLGTEREETEGIPSATMFPDHIPASNDTGSIISLLERSRRPLIAAGLTARRLAIQPYLSSFLDKYKIPFVVTPMAKGIISEHHPSYAGVLFHALSDYIEDLYEKTDLVLGIGYDPVEFNYESWIPRVPLIHFDTKETDMPPDINALQFAGKPAEWFNILENLNPGTIIPEHTLIKGIRDEMLSVFEGFTGHFGPVAAMKILREILPDDAVITADVGSHLHLLGQYWETGIRGNFIISNGWSGMGFGIPSAIAASIAKPFLRCVCITGDGGFLMSAGELMTARRYNIPVIVVVFSDGELNLIKLKQLWKDITPYGTSLYHGDMFGSDIFLGIKVLKADSHETMIRSAGAALDLKEPVIINAIIDPDDYKWLVVKR
ncbi:MAG TPA: acetolactate synthase [Bacteroidales bacterium]|nr:acetolactate synthase [Bacteroidales bacterium]